MFNENFSLPLDTYNQMKSVKFEELLGFIFAQGLLVFDTKRHKIVSAPTDIICTINFLHNFTLWHSRPHTYSTICMQPKIIAQILSVCLCMYMQKQRMIICICSVTLQLLDLFCNVETKAIPVFCAHVAQCISCYFFSFISSKMINFSVPDTIDERTINKKKLTPFTIQVLKHSRILCFSPQDAFV